MSDFLTIKGFPTPLDLNANGKIDASEAIKAVTRARRSKPVDRRVGERGRAVATTSAAVVADISANDEQIIAQLKGIAKDPANRLQTELLGRSISRDKLTNSQLATLNARVEANKTRITALGPAVATALRDVVMSHVKRNKRKVTKKTYDDIVALAEKTDSLDEVAVLIKKIETHYTDVWERLKASRNPLIVSIVGNLVAGNFTNNGKLGLSMLNLTADARLSLIATVAWALVQGGKLPTHLAAAVVPAMTYFADAMGFAPSIAFGVPRVVTVLKGAATTEVTYEVPYSRGLWMPDSAVFSVDDVVVQRSEAVEVAGYAHIRVRSLQFEVLPSGIKIEPRLDSGLADFHSKLKLTFTIPNAPVNGPGTADELVFTGVLHINRSGSAKLWPIPLPSMRASFPPGAAGDAAT